MVLSQHPRLSPPLFTQLSAYAIFKANFHRVYIQAQKDPEQKWNQFPYLLSETDVHEIIGLWPTKWCTLSELDIGTSTGAESFIVQKRKDATKKVMRNLVEQKKKEAIEKARIEHEHTPMEQVEKEQHEL